MDSRGAAVLGVSNGVPHFGAGGFGRHEQEQKWTFTEWLPEARRVFLIGDFNNWETRHPRKPCQNGSTESDAFALGSISKRIALRGVRA